MLSKFCVSPALNFIIPSNKEYMDKQIMFETQFDEFSNIKKGDKLTKSDNIYYVQSTGYFQTVQRLWSGDNRKKTFDDLDKDFSLFLIHCDELKSDKKKNPFNNGKLYTKVLTLVNKIIPGLYNLKKTYEYSDANSDGGKLCYKIDSIIFTLIDFKTEMNKPIFIKGVKKLRTLSF
jgi:hypothetical protein